jgi:hypothetical protein
MRVKSLVEHRYHGETMEEGKTYDLTPESNAKRAIAEGFVEEVVHREGPLKDKKK